MELITKLISGLMMAYDIWMNIKHFSFECKGNNGTDIRQMEKNEGEINSVH